MPSRSPLHALLTELGRIDWRRDGWRDVLCILFLLAVGWHLAGHDGGKPLGTLLPGLTLGLLVVATTYPELARLSAAARWLVVGWALGPVLALAAAHVRAGWVQPTAALALALPTFLAAHRLWHRPWGPLVLGVVAGLAVVRAWWEAFLAFWGGSGGNAWLAVSWHNQSGTLMGVMALVGFGLAAGGRGWGRWAGFILAAGGGAGVWLAASRAAIVLAVVALGVGAVVALRHEPARRVAVGLGVTLAVAVAATLALGSLATGPGTGTERLTERGLDSQNLMVRFDYWQGAWGMFREAPLTGTGPGSYRWSSLPHASFGTARSASVHNEYLDVLAGHGLLGGLPVWIVALAGAWLVLLAMSRPSSPVESGSPGQAAGVVASAAVLALLGLHAGFDFDWDYPILLVASVVAFSVLYAFREGTPGAAPPSGHPARRHLLTASAAAASSLVLATSLWGVAKEAGPEITPWELDGRLFQARQHLEKGETAEARDILAQAVRWNPGSHSPPAMIAIADFRDGLLTADELASWISRSPAMDDRLLVAEHLVESERLHEADRVLDGLRPFMEERRRWRVRGRVLHLVELSVRIVYREGGCDGVQDTWPLEIRWAGEFDLPPGELLRGLGHLDEVSSCL